MQPSLELSDILEQAILDLPDSYRSVLVMRDVEELSTAECAAILEVSEENVKIRLHRARGMLRKELYVHAGLIMPEPCPFLSRKLPVCSIIRPTETKGAPMGAVKFLTAVGLFIGQSKEFFQLLMALAKDADQAKRECH